MTDPKLPPLPRDSWNGMYSEQQIQEHWLDGYRAGQSSVDPTPPAGDQSAASKLWMLLDDIDTLDDACRDDDRAFRDSVRKVQQKRFAIMDGPHTAPKGGQKP